jgi:hypothetical protein
VKKYVEAYAGPEPAEMIHRANYIGTPIFSYWHVFLAEQSCVYLSGTESKRWASEGFGGADLRSGAQLRKNLHNAATVVLRDAVELLPAGFFLSTQRVGWTQGSPVLPPHQFTSSLKV